jgi:hypothetical protein
MSTLQAIWQYERSKLNHDWLKGDVLPRLYGSMNVLNQANPENSQVLLLLQPILDEWPDKSHRLRNLISEFEEAVSPRFLLDKLFAGAIDSHTLESMKIVLHEVWKRRIDAGQLVRLTQDKIAKADQYYVAVKGELWVADASASESKRFLSSARVLLPAFADACAELSVAISQFPKNTGVL